MTRSSLKAPVLSSIALKVPVLSGIGLRVASQGAWEGPEIKKFQEVVRRGSQRSFQQIPTGLQQQKDSGSVAHGKVPAIFRSEKLQNESSPNFSNFRPEFSSKLSPSFFRRNFQALFPGTETTKNSPKILALFQCQIPRQIRKNIFTTFFWRAGQGP